MSQAEVEKHCSEFMPTIARILFNEHPACAGMILTELSARWLAMHEPGEARRSVIDVYVKHVRERAATWGDVIDGKAPMPPG